MSEYKLIDAARRLGRSRRRRVDEPVEDMADRLPAPAPERAFRLADRERAIAGLPPRERGVVAALGIEGLSVKGAAARFAISETAVRVAFHRGLARLSRLTVAGQADPPPRSG